MKSNATMHDFHEQVKDDPVDILIDDLKKALKAGDSIGVNGIIKKIKLLINYGEPLKILNAFTWLNEEPAPLDQIIQDIIDTGDKLTVIGAPKVRKTFIALQLALCCAAGKQFIGLNIPKARRVIYSQFEVRDKHFHRRLIKMCRALGIKPEDLRDRFFILNARGLRLSGADGIERIHAAIKDLKPELVIFDPLYKIATGVENAAEDMKNLLACFDELAEETGAAIGSVHHDSKGNVGDKNIQDRGAGSNVLSRDYDACLALSPHATEPDTVVVDILLRNYAPVEPFAIQWKNEGKGYCFHRSDDITPEKKTSWTRPAPPALSTYYPVAEKILEQGEMDIKIFKIHFKEKTGLSSNRITEFMAWAENPKEPRFLINEKRGRGEHYKRIRLADLEEPLDL